MLYGIPALAKWVQLKIYVGAAEAVKCGANWTVSTDVIKRIGQTPTEVLVWLAYLNDKVCLLGPMILGKALVRKKHGIEIGYGTRKL